MCNLYGESRDGHHLTSFVIPPLIFETGSHVYLHLAILITMGAQQVTERHMTPPRPLALGLEMGHCAWPFLFMVGI